MANTGYQILKYTVDQADALATAVAGLAATGWLPQGGAAIDNGHLYQTLVKGDIAGVAGTGDVYILPAATTSAIGGVKAAVVQADSAAAVLATLVTDFNALLAKLKTSGAMASS